MSESMSNGFSSAKRPQQKASFFADVQSYFGIAAVLLVVAGALVGHTSEDRSARVLSDLCMIFGTFYISFLISRYFSQLSSRRELHVLGEASGARIFLLSHEMASMAERLLNLEPDGPTSKIHYHNAANDLTRLATHAELSFEDLKRIADVDISIPQLRQEAAVRVEESYRREKIQCPHCRHDIEIPLGAAAGNTKHGQCDDCRKLFIAHRLSDGAIKLSITDDIEIVCPNDRCSQRIRISRGATESGTTIRNCYECFARIHYDLDRGEVEGFEIEAPLEVKSSEILDGTAKCPYCSGLVSIGETRNSREERIQSCRNCTRLIKVSERTGVDIAKM